MIREYSLLSTNGFIITINGKQGQTHPHTWEFVVTMVVDGEGFVEFGTFEALIAENIEREEAERRHDEVYRHILGALRRD